MQPSLRSFLRAGLFPAATSLLSLVFLTTASAQTQTAPSSSQSAAASTPAAQQRTVITNDDIALPSGSHPQRSAAPPEPQPASRAQKAAQPPAEGSANNTAEIAALQKQIRDKQKRIELLMHLFVADERQFVQSPTDAQPDSTAQARVHFEQEELRAETAACARLQTRLDALAAASGSSH